MIKTAGNARSEANLDPVIVARKPAVIRRPVPRNWSLNYATTATNLRASCSIRNFMIWLWTERWETFSFVLFIRNEMLLPIFRLWMEVRGFWPRLEGVWLSRIIIITSKAVLLLLVSKLTIVLFRELRYAAYRNVASWIFGRLGKKVRRILPSCVIAAIRRVSTVYVLVRTLRELALLDPSASLAAQIAQRFMRNAR